MSTNTETGATGEQMSVPALPNVARSILKGAIVSLANAGLITSADAECVLSLLGLRDA